MTPLFQSNHIDQLGKLHINSNQTVIEKPYKVDLKKEPVIGDQH